MGTIQKELYDLYWNKNLSFKKIAKKYNKNTFDIWHLFKKYDAV